MLSSKILQKICDNAALFSKKSSKCYRILNETDIHSFMLKFGFPVLLRVLPSSFKKRSLFLFMIWNKKVKIKNKQLLVIVLRILVHINIYKPAGSRSIRVFGMAAILLPAIHVSFFFNKISFIGFYLNFLEI